VVFCIEGSVVCWLVYEKLAQVITVVMLGGITSCGV